MRVLIVYEDRDIADFIASALHFAGHSALPLYCPFDAMDHVDEIGFEPIFDVALIGLETWGLSGVVFGGWLRYRCPGIIILGVEEGIQVAKASPEGADFEYLCVPFQIEELLAKVQEVYAHPRVVSKLHRKLTAALRR